jgi:CRP/FNR family transcriptional regulator, cyclic AMP receptor protein
METLERILAEHPFSRDLDKRYTELLVGCAANVRFEPGQFLFREGDEANQFYLIRHGVVSVEVLAGPSTPTTITTMGEGEVLGWSWLFPPYRWKFDARAVELTRAIALDGKCLRTKCEADHDLGYELLKRFAYMVEQRLDAMRLQLLNIYESHT